MEILKYMSQNIRESLKYKIEDIDNLEEIRIRTNRNISLKIGQAIKILPYIATQEDLLETFSKICENSVYSYKKQICEGFITIKGGNRVGITGNCVIENGEIKNIDYISSLNFRIASQRNGCSQKVLEKIIDKENNTIFNTIIASTPGAGKTTMLKDLIKNISSGNEELNLKPQICGVVDERGEIAAMYRGIIQNDLGPLTDVMENVSKNKGMRMLIRSMSPNVIFCDEIGTKEDVEAIRYATLSGVSGVFTAHANSLKEIKENKDINRLIEDNLIKRIIILDNKKKGKIKEIYEN